VVKAALALNCEISRDCKFARKNYFYPDLPKGYQISQYEDPIGHDGWLDITLDNGEIKRIHIRRVHLEEDAGKLVHAGGNESEVDYNRGGVPLMEIVTEFPPDIITAAEGKAYLEKLRSILVYIGATDGKMEEGHLRCEPNVSIRPVGSNKYGVKTELKNLNSFRAVERGIAYELERHADTLDKGGVIRQETMGWNDAAGKTYHMRFKEEEQEYRYFPEPDMAPLHFEDDEIEAWRAELPELPDVKRQRFIDEFDLRPYDAEVLTASKPVADFFEETAKAGADPKAVANYVTGELMRLVNASSSDITTIKISPDQLAALLKLRDAGTITNNIAKSILEEMFQTGDDAQKIIDAKGIAVVSDEGAIIKVVEDVIAANPDVVAKILAGNHKSAGFLVGQIMKITKGQARPDLVNKLLASKLGI
jgi:aspartyl-tRNA(Asn)/glutamyl-tRNA(Gln) amidotransferase subunit B